MSCDDGIVHETVKSLMDIVIDGKELQFAKPTYLELLKIQSEKLRDVLGPAQQYCDKHPEEQKELADTVADALLNGIRQELASLPRMNRAMLQDKYLMFVVTFFSPALLQQEYPIGHIICESFRLAWQALWPKQDYRVVTGEEIFVGFDKKWYKCYITQAVCESLGKSDDCFELNEFRAFRDNYLITCPDGPALIDAYYKYAPDIICRIFFRRDRDAIYRRIWEEDVQGCLDDILQGECEDCKRRYSLMVKTLRQEFLPV